MNEPQAGFFSSLKRGADTVLATVQNRVELFALELREEKCRLIEAAVLVAALVALGTLTLTLLTFTIVVLLWDTAREATLITLSVAYLVATGLVARALAVRLKNRAPLSATLEELRKDRVCLSTEKPKA